jgi:hypothetical protein
MPDIFGWFWLKVYRLIWWLVGHYGETECRFYGDVGALPLLWGAIWLGTHWGDETDEGACIGIDLLGWRHFWLNLRSDVEGFGVTWQCNHE